MSTLALQIESGVLNRRDVPGLLPAIVGFFFVFRVCLTFLFFQANPATGTVAAIAIDLALLYCAILHFVGTAAHVRRPLFEAPVMRWIFAMLLFSLLSVSWTAAPSLVAALGYWTSTAADVVIVLLLLRRRDPQIYTEEIMKGMVWGAVVIAAVAWCSPATADLRLGNDLFLHPNTLGLEIAIATLVAQYLIPRGARWKWLAIALAITLLRTFSKTAIIAFLIAECWYLLHSQTISRRVKRQIAIAALLVVGAFWSLINSYIEVYNNTGSGNQAETLTGRTVLWSVAFAMGLDKLWVGHGLYSFKTLIPAFGAFEPVHAHNELLQQFFEFGVTGVVIAIGVYWAFYRQARKASTGSLRTLALSLLIFSLLHGLTDTVPFGLSYPLWMLTSLSLCLIQAPIAEAHPS